jgi:Protein kinase domain
VSNGATPPSSAATFAAGSRVAGYRLEEQIGRGGMAVVFQALDERLNRRVALKVLGSAQVDEAFRQRFVRESQAAAAVDDAHIIPVYEAGEADGVLFIAMRLVRGGDLRTLVARHGPLSPARAGWILSCVASALDAAHARGLVHRDVKPANMLLDVRSGRPDHVYLSDFGVSKAAIETGGLTDHGQFVGTADYAAPEQIQGLGVDGRTDQYALGCSAYELLCGQPPFSGRDLLATVYAQVSQPHPVPSSVRAELRAAVDEVFARVLAKSPADRYGSCEEFAAELRSALGLVPYTDRPAVPRYDQAGGSDGEDAATLDPAAARIQADRIRAAPRDSWPDSGSTIQMPAGAAEARTSGAPRRHLGAADGVRWRRALAGVLAVAVVAGGAAAFALTHGRTPAAAVPVRVGPARYGGGLVMTQVWQLSGSRGTSLDVTITVRNTSAKVAHVLLDEPIPAAVAKKLGSVRANHGGKVLAGIRVLVWDLPLKPASSVRVGFRVPEPADGATAARLNAWVSAFRKVATYQDLELLKPGGKPVLKYLMITPPEVWLYPSQSYALTLGGVLSNADSAPVRDLSGAIWSSQDPSVVTVTPSGVILSEAPGTTVVTARIGFVTASAIVTVLAAGSAQTGPVTSPPSGQSSPASTPASSAPASPTTSSSSPASSSTTSSSPASSSSASPTSPAPGSSSPAAAQSSGG